MHFLKNILSIIGVTHHSDKDITALEDKFGAHVAQYGLSFGTTEEYEFRLAQFAKYDAEINAINAREGNTFVSGHNQFSTWTSEEYKMILGRQKNVAKTNATFEEPTDVSTLPTSVDWRSKGAVNAIQDQGRCGSCWAFASTAAMEGAHAIKSGNLLKLAEQELVDCDTQSGGCNGGLEIFAYEYAEKHTMELETDYPYTARNGRCKYASSKGQVGVTTYAQPKPKSVDALKASIAQGPTTVAVDAADSAWQFYQKGILNDYSCGTDLDHAVIAVGYGTENGLDYFIIRNSWSASWGEDGYIRLAADKDGSGVCGVLLDTARPTTD